MSLQTNESEHADLRLAHEYALTLLAKQARELPEKIKAERAGIAERIDACVTWDDVTRLGDELRGEP